VWNERLWSEWHAEATRDRQRTARGETLREDGAPAVTQVASVLSRASSCGRGGGSDSRRVHVVCAAVSCRHSCVVVVVVGLRAVRTRAMSAHTTEDPERVLRRAHAAAPCTETQRQARRHEDVHAQEAEREQPRSAVG
jgi:hypothetical protein